MSRFLLVVPPLAGHVNPALGLGHALAARGHEVAWACSETFIRPLVGPAATVYRTGMRLYRPQSDRGAAAMKSLWEEFIVPFARFTRPAVEQAVQAYRPDVMVVDQHAVAGAIVARQHGLRWASLAPGSMELTRPYRALSKVNAWMRGHCAALCAEAGLPRDETFDPRFSPYLVLACTTAALTGPAAFPDHFALVGPMLAGQASRAGLPPHILAVPQVPLLDLIPHLDAVTCHGGMNTVGEALAHGVPLVVAPIRHDQPITAAQVVAAAAGIRVRFARVRPAQLRAAVTAVLDGVLVSEIALGAVPEQAAPFTCYPAIPANSTRYPQEKELQEAVAPELDTALRERVIESIGMVLPRMLEREIPAVTESMLLMDELGLRSTAMIELLVELEEDLGIQIDVEDIDRDDMSSVGDLASFVASHALGSVSP